MLYVLNSFAAWRVWVWRPENELTLSCPDF